MFIGAIYIEIFIPESSSLKEKRQILKSVKDKIRNNFNVSVAEVNYQDLWQRSGIAVVCVGDSIEFAEETVTKIKNFVERNFPHLVVDFKKDYYKIEI